MHEQMHQLVADQMRHYGASLQPPCDEQRLATLRRRVREELRHGLLVEIEDFLRLTDGLNWNGLYLYPSSTAALVGHPNVVLAGLVETNLDHHIYDDEAAMAAADESRAVHREHRAGGLPQQPTPPNHPPMT